MSAGAGERLTLTGVLPFAVGGRRWCFVDPRDSRRVLAFCLETVRESDARRLRPNTFGVARM